MLFVKNLRLLILCSIVFVSCSQKVSTVIEKPVEKEITIPAYQGVIQLNQISTEKDSQGIYFGVLVDSLQNELAQIKVFFESKSAELTLNKRVVVIKDTIRDTVIIENKETTISPVIELLSPVEKIILFSIIGLFSSFVIWKRLKGMKL